MPKATPRQKQSAAERLRRLGLSPRALYRDGRGFGLLKRLPLNIRRADGGHLIAVGDADPPAYEVSPREFDDYPFHPSDFLGWVWAELISLAEQRVVGICEGRVYYLIDMAGLFGPEAFVRGLDDEDVDCGRVGEELRRRRALQFLLADFPDTNLLHITRLGVARPHRGRALGLKMVEAVTEFAAARLDCGYAIMKPSPIKYEEGDPYTDDDPRFAGARRRLFAYYGSLGFVRPSARSEYLYKKL